MKTKVACLVLLAGLNALPLVLTTGCAVTSGRESAGEYTDDAATTARVKTALVRDPIVKAHQVNVTTFRGIVQLSGFVDTQAQKDRATEVARGIKGVQELRNDLVVPTGR
jgi:hyperosmotically inducible protein